MATTPRKKLQIGTIIDGTVDVLGRSVGPGLIYILVFATLGGVTDYLSQGTTMRAALYSLIVALASIFGTYLLTEKMLRNTGQSTKGNALILPYFGMSILMILALIPAFILLVVPGLILLSRWIVASPTMIAEGKGVMDSLGESWKATAGKEWPIIASFLLLVVLLAATSTVMSRYVPDLGVTAIAVSRLAGAASSVISACLSVAVYRLLSSGEQAARPFE